MSWVIYLDGAGRGPRSGITTTSRAEGERLAERMRAAAARSGLPVSAVVFREVEDQTGERRRGDPGTAEWRKGSRRREDASSG